MARASPAWRVCGDKGLRALVEGHRASRFESPSGTGGLAGLDRVLALLMKLSGGGRLLPGLGERNVVERSESHSPLVTVALEPVNPGPADRPAPKIKSDLEVQPAAIWVAAGASRFQLDGRKSVQCH